MTRAEMAEYLVNLHTLLQAQESAGGIKKSQALLDEYNTVWDAFKTELTDDSRETAKIERKV